VAASERLDQTYAESSKSVKSVLASTSTFLSSGILDDIPTGITPKKKTWNVPQSWERTEPREALLEAFRRRKVSEEHDYDHEEPQESSSAPPSPVEVLPTFASVESIPSVTSLPVSKMKKPTGKLDKLPSAGNGEGVKEERVVIPLGESLGNIPAPRRVRR
jgi:kinesin family protein 11